MPNDSNFDRTDFEDWVEMATTSVDSAIQGLGDVQNELRNAAQMNGLDETLIGKKIERLTGSALGLQLLANSLRSDIVALGYLIGHPEAFTKAPPAAAGGNHTPHPTPREGRAHHHSARPVRCLRCPSSLSS